MTCQTSVRRRLKKRRGDKEIKTPGGVSTLWMQARKWETSNMHTDVSKKDITQNSVGP